MEHNGRSDVVILVHGTFASQKEDDVCQETDDVWWLRGSTFAAAIHKFTEGNAQCWPDDLCEDSRWRSLMNDRKVFAWSGENVDSERRAAGSRLLEALTHLSEQNRRCHMVGHSHGGTVIWHALEEATRRGLSLGNVASWTTLGTPFPIIMPEPLQWFKAPSVLLTFAILTWLTGVYVLLPLVYQPQQLWDVFLNGLSPLTLVGLVLLAAGFLSIVVSLASLVLRQVQARREKTLRLRTWKQFGDRWLGLFTDYDEAIVGTQMAVGLYLHGIFPARWPTRPYRFTAWTTLKWVCSWPLAIIIKMVVAPSADFLVSSVIRNKLQGADRISTRVAYMSCEPVFHQNARGPMPFPMREALHKTAREELASSYDVSLERLSASAFSNQPAVTALQEHFSNFQPGGELIHTSYYRVEQLRRAVAFHILDSAKEQQDAAAEGKASLADRIVTDPETRNWLRRRPGKFEEPFPPQEGERRDPDKTYRAARKPIENQPASVGILYSIAVVLLIGALCQSLRSDIQTLYVTSALQRARRQELVTLQQLVEEPVARAAKAGERADRTVAIEALAMMERPLRESTKDVLLEVMVDKAESAELRIAAIMALLEQAEYEVFKEMLGDAESSVPTQRMAAWALACLATSDKEHEETKNKITEAFRDIPNEDVRNTFREALVAINSDHAHRILLDLWRSYQDSDVKFATELIWEFPDEFADKRIKWLWQCEKQRGDVFGLASQVTINLLDGVPPGKKAQYEKQAIFDLTKKDASWRSRCVAATMLGNMQSVDAGNKVVDTIDQFMGETALQADQWAECWHRLDSALRNTCEPATLPRLVAVIRNHKDKTDKLNELSGLVAQLTTTVGKSDPLNKAHVTFCRDAANALLPVMLEVVENDTEGGIMFWDATKALETFTTFFCAVPANNEGAEPQQLNLDFRDVERIMDWLIDAAQPKRSNMGEIFKRQPIDQQDRAIRTAGALFVWYTITRLRQNASDAPDLRQTYRRLSTTLNERFLDEFEWKLIRTTAASTIVTMSQRMLGLKEDKLARYVRYQAQTLSRRLESPFLLDDVGRQVLEEVFSAKESSSAAETPPGPADRVGDEEIPRLLDKVQLGDKMAGNILLYLIRQRTSGPETTE